MDNQNNIDPLKTQNTQTETTPLASPSTNDTSTVPLQVNPAEDRNRFQDIAQSTQINPTQQTPVAIASEAQSQTQSLPPNPAISNMQNNSTPTAPLIDPQSSHNKVAEPKQKNGILSFALTIIGALLLTQLLNMFFFQSYRVYGNSMFPTLHNGDRLIISKVSKSVSQVTKKPFLPNRNEIIVFTSPKEPDMQLIKRVIGLPGERVVVSNGKLTVYNNEFPDGFNPDDGTDHQSTLPASSGQADVIVPEGEIFVSGDNREGTNSLDSRNELGTVPLELIIGTNSVRLWPIQSARFF